MIKKLSIDIETFCTVSIKAGTFKYAESCEIILFAYSFDDRPVEILDYRFTLPPAIKAALVDPNVIKYAYNAAFERACLSAYFNIELPPEQWRCTMVRAAMCGLPFSLDQASKALNLSVEKDSKGKELINYFCVPCKPTKINGLRTRNLPIHNIEKWELFKKYCINDVIVEKKIYEACSWFPISDFEQRQWAIDQRINGRGVLIDTTLVIKAILVDAAAKQKLTAAAIKLTGLKNPNSVKQLTQWLETEEEDLIVTSLTKGSVAELLKTVTSSDAKKLLNLRVEMAKTSVSKYAAMLSGLCFDSRIRGIHQYYGANRTGRYAGRLFQPQNLPRISYTGPELHLCRELVLDEDIDTLDIFFGSVPGTLSQLIRTALVAAPGKHFIVSDYSSIEARVLAWLANEMWKLDVFKTHGKIYEATASQMFHVPVEKITKTSDLRQKGKIAELACGYQGGPDALLRMGAVESGTVPEALLAVEQTKIFNTKNEALRFYNYDKDLQRCVNAIPPVVDLDTGAILCITVDRDEVIRIYLQELVTAWRKANPNIVKFWYALGDAAKRCLRTGEMQTVVKGIYFEYRNRCLLAFMPSGRALCYQEACLRDVQTKFGVRETIIYKDVSQKTKKWEYNSTYGGKLAENFTQAIARDILAQGIDNLYTAGYETVLHVHDETVNEVPIGKGSLEEVNELMIKLKPWMEGLPLAADGFITDYYKK
jgi:DNA polymerase